MKNNCLQMNKKQQGMSLLEVLIAALILGVALVSIAVMQMNALKISSNSNFRTAAADIATALAGRMRVNAPGVIGADIGSDKKLRDATDNGYLVNWKSTDGCGALPTQCATDSSSTAGGSAIEGGCTPAEVAAWDLYEASCAPDIGLNDLIPEAELQVTCNYVTTKQLFVDDCNIRISWSGSANIDKTGAKIGDGKETLIFNVLPGAQKIDKDPVIKL